MFSRLFTDHPHAMGESYWEHQRFALGFAGSLLVAGAACLVHALVPALCERTGSRAIEDLHGRLLQSRRIKASPSQLPHAIP
jgi:hypothetical protein